MRRLFTIIAALLLTASIWAQSPQRMSYQAVIRNSLDQLVTTHAVGMRISILQGSSSGTVVYTENQTPTTNANGLVSIEIGGGAGFSSIDWANGSFFIKTETDPAGGTNYTITGTSQILSVPYALHAKTAESVSFANGISLPYNFGSDPDFVGSLGNFIGFGHQGVSEDFIGYKNNTFYLKDSPDGGDIIDPDLVVGGKIGVGIEDPAEKLEVDGNINIHNHTLKNLSNPVNAQDAATKAYVDATGATTLAVGDSYQGGIIFWLDATGQHGLIAATADQNTGIEWYNGTNRYTGASGNGLYAGAMNTTIAIATQMADDGPGYFAARDCADYTVTVGGVTYGDWYLPSHYELNLLYLQRAEVGGFTSNIYWSSTEDDSYNVWFQYFNSGNQELNDKDGTYYVRAIRAF